MLSKALASASGTASHATCLRSPSGARPMTAAAARDQHDAGRREGDINGAQLPGAPFPDRLWHEPGRAIWSQ